MGCKGLEGFERFQHGGDILANSKEDAPCIPASSFSLRSWIICHGTVSGVA